MPSKTPSRPEGEKWFEWPLTPASVGMTAAELIGELYETISTLNRDRVPALGDLPGGYTLLCCEGVSLGWGKQAGGLMKNHYPKGLRRR